MFVFVYSSYHLKLSFPHLVINLITLDTPKNIFCFNNNIMQNDNAARIRGHYHESSGCFEYPKISLLKSSHPKKHLPNFPTPKNPESKISNPKKILRSSPSLEIRSTPPPPLGSQWSVGFSHPFPLAILPVPAGPVRPILETFPPCLHWKTIHRQNENK